MEAPLCALATMTTSKNMLDDNSIDAFLIPHTFDAARKQLLPIYVSLSTCIRVRVLFRVEGAVLSKSVCIRAMPSPACGVKKEIQP